MARIVPIPTMLLHRMAACPGWTYCLLQTYLLLPKPRQTQLQQSALRRVSQAGEHASLSDMPMWLVSMPLFPLLWSTSGCGAYVGVDPEQ